MQNKNVRRNKLLFLIDDDTDDQEIFKSALAEVDETCIVRTASNGIEALQALSVEDIHPDLIFVDLNMPKMDGIQFLQQIREAGILSKTPIIIYTTSAHPNEINKTKELGAVQFITKPTRYAELQNLLRSLLNESTI